MPPIVGPISVERSVGIPVVGAMNQTCSPSPENPVSRTIAHVGGRKSPFVRLVNAAAADLTDEDIERSIAVREKDHELAVRRDRGVDLLALEVGQTHGPRVSERVLPEVVVDPEAPGDADRGRENNRGDPTDRSPAA